MSENACVICNTEGVVIQGGGGTYEAHCPVCFRYEITMSADAMVAALPMEKRLLLAGVVRRHWAETKRPIRVASETVDSVKGPTLVSVLQKQDALLFDLASRSPYPGAVVKLQPLDCVVVDASPGDELTYHLQSMIERKLLQAMPTIYEGVLTALGWEHLDRLRNPSTGNRSDIFVAMSFAPELRSAWEDGLKPGIADAGYRAQRVDSTAHNDKIDDRIIAGIRACYAVVVDVTTQNQGAYFEAGFAMGLGRPVVWTVRESDIAKLHFDTRQFNHLVWATPTELAEKLSSHLIAVFGRGPIRQ
jgi:hypothetical protein